MSKLKGCTEKPTEVIMTHIHSKIIKNIEHAFWKPGVILKMAERRKWKQKIRISFYELITLIKNITIEWHIWDIKMQDINIKFSP